MKRTAEGPVTALHTVVMLAGTGEVAAYAFKRHPVELNVNVEILARDSRKFCRDHVAIGGLMNVDRRHPAGRTLDKSVPAMVNGDEIANWIPALERHEFYASTGPVSPGTIVDSRPTTVC